MSDADTRLDRDRSSQRDPSERRQRAQVWLLAVIAVILAGATLRVAGIVVIPLIIALFIALMVAPVDRWVAERTASWAGHLAAMALILVALLGFAAGLWVAADRVVTEFPAFSSQLQSVLPGTESQSTQPGAAVDGSGSGDGASRGAGSAAGGTPWIGGMLDGAAGDVASRLADLAASVARQVIASAAATLGALIIIFFLTLLMLIEAPHWRSKMASILDRGEKRDWFDSLGLIAERLRRYLLARTVLGLITAALYIGWLAIFGVDLLIVWGLIAFLLNFVPNLGSLVAGVVPVLYAFVQKDTGTAVLIGAGIFAIEQVMGNFIDPRVQGRQVAVSPLVVLIVILLWGWIWGIAGAILAVPITIAMIVIFSHIPVLRPLALMLSSETDAEGLDRITRRD